MRLPRSARWLGSIVFAVTTVVGCRRAGPELDLGVLPRYACRGDTVTITFSLQDVEGVEVKDAAGSLVAQSSGHSGVVAVKNVQPDMLPMTATGSKGGRSRSWRIPGDMVFAIVDGTVATESFQLRVPQFGDDLRSRIGTADCGCTLDDDGAPLLCENAAPVVDVSRLLEGYQGLLDAAWFSPRAHVVGITNESAWRMTYFHNGNQIVPVGPGGLQAIDFASEIMPAGTWSVRFDARDASLQYVGIFVDGGAVCSGWTHRRPDPAARKADLKLSLRCPE